MSFSSKIIEGKIIIKRISDAELRAQSSELRAQEGITRVKEEKGMNQPDLRSKKHHGAMHRLTETAMDEICGLSLRYTLCMFGITQQN